MTIRKLHLLWSAVVGVLVGALLGVVAPPAFASAHYSLWKSFNSGSIPYHNRSAIITPESPHLGGTTVGRTDGQVPAARKMGARARVFFTSSGALCADSDMQYLNVATAEWTQWVTYSCPGSYVYSKGATNTWTGIAYSFDAALATSNFLG